MKKAATFFSYLLHPLLMPTVGILFLMFSGQYVSYMPFQARKMLVILAAVGTFALPGITIPMFVMRGSVSSLILEDRRDRLFPLAVTFVFYLLTFMLFLRIPVYRFIHAFMLGTAISVLVSLLITLRWKISTHLIGLGGLTGLIMYLSFYTEVNMIGTLSLVIFAAGLTASARVLLDAHSPAQVYAGYFTGFVIMLLTMIIY